MIRACYYLIIILAGTIEALRKQTQERLDAGFVGLDSNKLLSDEKKAVELLTQAAEKGSILGMNELGKMAICLCVLFVF